MAINSQRIRKPLFVISLITSLAIFGVLATYPHPVVGVTNQIDNPKTSSEQDLIDKVFTFLAPNDTLRFENLYLLEKVNHYVLLEIVTPHDCEINVTIVDPVLDVYNVFNTEVNISQDDDWFEIPFGTAIAGNYTFIVSVACALTLNLHIKISFDPEVKCLYDVISPKFLERMKLYQVNKFTDGMVVEHNTVLKTDISYKFYLGRVSAIGGLTIENEVRVDYDVTDPEELEFTIYQNKTVGSVGTIMHFDFGTAMEGIYTVKIRILCQVDVVNIAYVIAEDYQISTINNGTDPEPELYTNETASGYFYVPMEWTLAFGISAGALLGVLTIIGAVRRKKDSVSLRTN
jgi:hypothetical protein